MYHTQQVQIGFREIGSSSIWRGIANFFRKLVLALQESRTREVERLLAQYRDDRTPKLRG
jgi:hypothetical protein